MSEFVKKQFTAKGEALIHGEKIQYTAITENFPIHDKNYNIAASMYTTAYIRDCDNSSVRPVVFAWNGGPGCGSLYVHMGLLSPMIAKTEEMGENTLTAPFQMVRNENCLLDICDVVAIDAIGTGYSRLLNYEQKSIFYSSEGDAIAFIECIRAWMNANDRWNSPVYIMGESYGTIRCALIADYMFYHNIGFPAGAPIQLSGIIMIGTALNYGQQEFSIPQSALLLPSLAATNWYYSPEGKGSLEEYVAECKKFCGDTYIRALFVGKGLPEEERIEVAKRVSEYSGYSVEMLMKNNIEVDVLSFSVGGNMGENTVTAVYDSRFQLKALPYNDNHDFFADDPSNQFIMPAFTSAYGQWRKTLNIDIDDEYIEFAADAESWNLKTKTTPVRSLENAMYRNPKLKLMFCMGYYDLGCPIGWVDYLVNHYEIPKDRTWLKYYKSGHIAYAGEQQTAELEQDIKDFIMTD